MCMSKYFTILALIISITAHAQGDLILIKKNNLPFKTYMAGTAANFITTYGEAINTRIAFIKNDSLFFNELNVRQVMTQWGVPRLDTIAIYFRGIHYSEIAALPKPKKFSQLSISKLLMVGGAGFIAVNLVNSIYLNYPPFASDNLSKILPAAGAFATGFVISKLTSPYYTIGKKYTVEYSKLRTP